MSIDLRIGANVDDAVQGVTKIKNVLDDFSKQGKLSINVIEKSMQDLRIAIKQSTDPTEINKLKSTFTELQQRLNALKNEGGLAQQLGGISRASRLAHSDLEGVAQSIRGLATGSERGVDALSNIVFTFERLKGVSGGAGAALSAIGETLTGPAGIVLAITTLIPLMEGFIGKLFGASEAADEAAKKYKELVKSTTEGTAKEAAEVSGLVAVLQNQTESHERQLAAKKKLIEIAPEYFSNLNNEGASIKTITADYNAYINNLSKAIEFKLREAELEKLFAERLEKTSKLQLLTPITQQGKFGAPGLSEDQKKLQAEIDITNGKIKKLFDTIDEHHEVKLSIPDPSKEANKGLTEIQRKLIAVAEQAQEFFRVPLNLKFSVDDTDKAKLQKAIEIIKGIKDQTIRLNVIPPDEKDIKLPKVVAEIDKPEFTKSINDLLARKIAPVKLALDFTTIGEQLRKLNAQIDEAFKIDPKNITASLQAASDFILTEQEKLDSIKLATKLDIDPTELAKQVNEIKQFIPKNQVGELDLALKVGDIKLIGLKQQLANMNKDITVAVNDAVKNISVEGLSTIGEAIGTALSGGDIGNVFKRFGSFLGDAIESLGKQIIKLGIAASGLSKALKTLFANPVAAIAAGIALVAIGAAIKQAVGAGLKGFAQGGRPAVGQVAMVGERGPELFVPDVAGKIIPNHEIKNFSTQNIPKSINISSVINQKSFSDVSKTLSNFSSIINVSKLPHLQTGGITTSDTIAQLHKAEVIMPLDRLKGLIGNNTGTGYDLHSTEKVIVEGENVALVLDRYFKRKGRSF